MRSRISCFHSLSLLYEAPQVFFHIPIRDALNHLIFPSVEDELSGNWTITMLRLGACFFVYQMTVLLRRNSSLEVQTAPWYNLPGETILICQNQCVGQPSLIQSFKWKMPSLLPESTRMSWAQKV